MVQFMRTRWVVFLCLLLLFVQLAVQVRLSSQDSQTTDEAVHLAAGYTYITRGDFRFNPEHPPLVKTLAALPLLALSPNINEKAEQVWQQAGDTFFYDSWQENRIFGEEMMYNSGNNPDELIFWGRIPVVVLTFLLGLTLFLIAYRHWGGPAALVATSLYAFNPTVNGHGHLITTDIGLTLGFVLATYTFWQLLHDPSWRRAGWFGLAFGLALLTKHTAVILLPVFVVLLVAAGLNRTRSTSIKQTATKIVGALALTAVVIWAGFGFRDVTVPASKSISEQVYSDNLKATQRLYPDASWGNSDQYQLKITELNDLRTKVGRYDTKYAALQPILTILPGNYLKGVFLVIGHASNGHDSFLLGETSNKGWWYYFPLMIVFKTPLVALLLISAGIYLTVRNWRSSRLVQALTIAGGIYLLSAITSKANLGIRHIMPVLPFLFLIAGYATTLSHRYLRTSYVAISLLGLIYAATYPFYLSYFNELAGGSRNGYQIATDSNIDWGQDLERIARHLEKNNIRQPYVEYGWLGNYALDHYLGKNQYQFLSDYKPGKSGYAVINVSAIYGQDFSFLSNCSSREFITPGVIGCTIEASR
jgi:4-amino-4-deoxy-L-arabinose transferase-like glycosyltransferase